MIFDRCEKEGIHPIMRQFCSTKDKKPRKNSFQAELRSEETGMQVSEKTV
jgi:hypothetical protein